MKFNMNHLVTLRTMCLLPNYQLQTKLMILRDRALLSWQSHLSPDVVHG